MTPEGIIGTLIAYDSTVSDFVFYCSAGLISTVVGESCDALNFGQGQTDFGDVQATSVQLYPSSSITVDTNGAMYIYSGYFVHKVANGVSRVIAGNGNYEDPVASVPALSTGIHFNKWSDGITTDTTGRYAHLCYLYRCLIYFLDR